MANPQLDKFFKEAAAAREAKAAKPVAAAPKPPVLSASPAAPVKVAATVERSTPSAEPVTPSTEDVKKAEKMRADLLEELPLEEYYKAAGSFGLSDSALGVLEPKIPAARFRELAGVQGLDLEDMAQKAGAGVPFAEYRRTRDGVIGFKPAAERFTELDRVASDYEAAERGEAPQRTIGIQKAQETTTAIPGFGEGYEIGYTGADELIETTKPGEHQFSIAQQFVDSFEKAKPEVVHLTDMYAQNLGAGNTQKWIEKYVKLEARNRGITAADPDADEKMGKIRRDAVYYILAKKTIGQWTPGVFVKDVQITDAERAKPLGTGEGFGAGVRDTFAAMAPNVEIVGFNNKGQAVVRQESPAGVTLRLLDVLGVSPVGKVKGVPIVIPGQSAISGLITKEKGEGYLESALRGVQTGATFLDATLDATKGQSTPVRTAAGLAALVPTVLYPDVTMAAGDAYRGISAFRKTLQDRKIAKAAAPLLDDLVSALKAGDYEKATKIEAAIRVHPELSKGNHGIMQAQIRGDVQIAEKLQAMNPGLASLNPNLADDLITVGANQSPELAEAIYGEAVRGYPFLHFSRKAKELAAKVDKEGIGPTLEAYVNSGDFGTHFRRVERAKAAFLKEAPRNASEAIDRAITGLAANLRAKGAEAAKLGGAAAADAPRYDRLAKLIEDNKAAIITDPRGALKEDGALRSALKADPVTGAADAREFRAAFYRRDAALLSKRIESLKTVDFETLYKHDLEVFDRAREAIEANIKSRMMAAELLKRELGAQSNIKVVPTEILDDLMEPGTERLSAFATAKFIRTMQQLPASADRKAWLAAFQTLDAQLRGAAALRDVPVDTYWRLIDIRVVDGKPVFVKGEQVVSGAKVPKGANPLEGFVDIADVQTAIGRLRAALAGTDPTYNLKPLLRPDGTTAGGEVAVGDVVVRALQSFEEDAPYRVEVFVGGERKAAFTNTGSLEDAISDGIDEAQNALNGRVATGAPAMREVVGAAPPKTAAQAAAQTSPAAAAEEAAAVDKVAAMPPAAPLHPKTQEVLAGLDAALKADPDVVSRIISAVEKLKAGSKLPPPPKGANKVLMGAVREELLKSGVLVKLDDGSVVKAGTLPEDVKVAPTAAPAAPVTPAPVAAAAEAEAPVFQRVAEEVAPPVAPPAAPVVPRVAPAAPATPAATTEVERLQQQLARDTAQAREKAAAVTAAASKARKAASDLSAAQQELTRARDAARVADEKMFAAGEKEATRQAVEAAGRKLEQARQANITARQGLDKANTELANANDAVSGGKARIADAGEQARLAARPPAQVVRDTLEGYEVIATPDAVIIGKVQRDAAGNPTGVIVAQRYAKNQFTGPDDLYRALAKEALDPEFGLGGGWTATLPQAIPAGSRVQPLNIERVAVLAEAPAAAKVEVAPVAAARQLEEGARLEQEARRRLAVAAGEGDEAFDAAMAEVDAIVERNRALEKAIFATTPGAESTVIRRGEEALEFQRISEPAAETVAEPVIQRAPAAEEPLPAVRKAKGFRDKNSVNAGVYEVDIGGKTRRFFRDSKEGFYPRSFVEDVPTSADVPVLPFLGDTIEDAVKALQRKYVAEAAPVARAAEEAAAVPEAPAEPAFEFARDLEEVKAAPQKSWSDELLARNPEAVRAAEEATQRAATGKWVESKSTSTDWRSKNMPEYTAREGEFEFRISAERSRRKGGPSVVFRVEAQLADPRVIREETSRVEWAASRKSLEEAKAAVASDDAKRGLSVALANDIERGKGTRPQAPEAAEAPRAPATAVAPTPEQLATGDVKAIPAEFALPPERLTRGDDGEWFDPRMQTSEESEGLQYLSRPRKGRSVNEMEKLLAESGGNLAVAVRKLADTTTVPEYRAVANRLLELEDELRPVQVDIIRPGRLEVSELFATRGAALGEFDTRSGRVRLLGPEYASRGMSEETLLHEALHAVTAKRLGYDNVWSMPEITPASRKAISEARDDLRSIVSDLQAHVMRAEAAGTATEFERSPAMRNYILGVNGDELVSWALTNPGFQDYLKSVKLTARGTLWDRFVRMMSTLLGFEADETSTLARVLEASDKLMKAPYTTPTAAQKATREAVVTALKGIGGSAKEAASRGYVEIARRARLRDRTEARRADFSVRVSAVAPSTADSPLYVGGEYAGSLREAMDAGDFSSARALLRDVVAGERAKFEEYLRLIPDEPVPASGAKPATTTHAVAREEFTKLLDTAESRATAVMPDTAPEAVKAEEVAAPAQPTGITPAAEAPVVREEIVQPPVAPPVKAKPTVDEYRARVERLKPFVDKPLKRTNISKTGFDVDVAGDLVRVEKRGDAWVDTSNGLRLGDSPSEATETLHSKRILAPYQLAGEQLRLLMLEEAAKTSAATVASLEGALSRVGDIKTIEDAEAVFAIAGRLTLDAGEKAQVYESLAQKLEAMARRVRRGTAAEDLNQLRGKAEQAADSLRPRTTAPPTPTQAAADELTEAQRHAQAVTNIRSLTHRAEVDLGVRGNFLMFGGEQNGRFVPVYLINFRASSPPKPAEILESIYSDARLSPQIQEAARRDAEALLEGQTPVVSAFPANKYANDADLKFGPGLRQVRPAQAGGPEVVTGRFITGGATAAGSRGIIEIAAKTADPTTLLHEGAHFIRKTILDTEDMDNVTAWLNSMGVKVKHEFGEFVGSPDDIELAEEMFATAFEKYVVTGKAPTPALERAFELVKNAFAGAYRWMKSDAAKELYGDDALSPQVTNVFDKYFTAVPQKPVESTFDIIVRETRGARATDAEGALDVLAREATRKGMPKTTREDLVKKITNLKLPDDVPSETVLLEFPAPVLGKTEWTKGEIVELQAEVVRRRNQMALNPLRQAMFGSPEEEKVTEQVFAALAEREEGAVAAGARGVARGMAKLVLGGDIVAERGTRALPEVLRRDLDTPARIIETTIGDSISVLKQSTRDNDPQFMFRFLAGENLRFKSGRRVLSSGHEHIVGFFDLYRNQWSSMTREEQALLQEWAQLLNTHPNPENLRDAQTISDALSRAPFPQRLTNVENFADLKAQVQAKTNAMIAAVEKFINLGGSGEGSIGGQLRKAIKDAAGEGEQIAFNEYRFAEVLLYLSGATQRRGRQFIPVDGTYTKDQLLAQAEILLTDAQRIYGGDDDPLFSRRLSVLVAAYGSSRRAKGELAALGALLTEEEAYAFKSWTLGYNVSPEMSAQLELVKNKFGLNAKFVNETILGSDVYVPAQARARMVDALAKAQFNNTKLSPTGDLYQKVWTYMKKRMTRGAFALRQRYFFVNTIDHFNQMYLMVGFAPAAASSARLLLQGLPVNLFGQAGETFIRLANRAGMGDRAAMERFRDLLSRGGDELAFRINNMFSTAKYRIDVNDILEGREKLLLVGGNVYTARQLRDMFVAEGIFSSFDTRRLAEGVRMDGNIFANEMSRIATSNKTDGTFSNAAARLSDAAQDVTVDVVDDLADAWAERERVGAVITLMETGIEARAACRVTIDALYDYSQSMTKGDRSFLVGSVLPFWAFQKNANQQFVNVLFSPYGAYRMMALQRLREGSTELASELYYGYIGGELGLDVDNMPQDMQSLYYAIMTRAHEIYGDKLPDDVRIGLRIALTGRVSEVVDGKYYELDASLIEMMRKGGLVPGGKFGGVGMADYMLAAPNKSGLPSYVRDRFGMVAPQRRNALVRHYSALMGGANEDYFYFMLPESSVETAYKHTATLLGGAFITAGALTPEWAGIPGVDVFAGGAGAISLGDVGRALQPVVDLERSPVFGLAVGMYSERGYPQRLHPVVASALQKMGSVPILRVPAKMDPFMGGTLPDTDEAFKARLQAANAVEAGIIGGTDETGNPADLISILGEDYVRMVQELNSKDLPADVMAIAKEERFYLPPGFMSLSFENSPLGELNREIIRLDQTAKEGADPAGTAAYYTRILLGSDVIQVAPSRTAQQEEPVRYTKTRDPI